METLKPLLSPEQWAQQRDKDYIAAHTRAHGTRSAGRRRSTRCPSSSSPTGPVGPGRSAARATRSTASSSPVRGSAGLVGGVLRNATGATPSRSGPVDVDRGSVRGRPGEQPSSPPILHAIGQSTTHPTDVPGPFTRAAGWPA